MIKCIAGVMVLCGVAAAGPKERYVDVSVTFKRTVTDDGGSSEKSGSCTTTSKAHQVLTVQVMVVASKIKITDSSDRIDLSVPMDNGGKLTGQAQYTFTTDSHKASCDGKEDLVGSATANADAKDVQVIFYFDKKPQTGALTVSPSWGDAKGQGKLTSTSKSGGGTVDAGPMIAAQGGMIVASSGGLTLDTKPTLDQLDKAAKPAHDVMTQFAQGKPLVVSTPGSAIDLQYSDTETTDLAKLQPPPGPGKTSTLVRKVTTEVSIHATPSK